MGRSPSSIGFEEVNMFRRRLIAPGPVETSQEVGLAMASAQIHHRSPEARAVVTKARAALKRVYGLPDAWEAPLILTSSGTGAFEAALMNLVPTGAEVVNVSAGKFGERWGEMARALGYTVHERRQTWGKAIPVSWAAELLETNPKATALLITHSETSTGVLHDLERIVQQARAVKPDVLLIVDAITSLGVSELRPAEWGLDAVISGSQKAVAGPPGLGFLALSPRALGLVGEGEHKVRPYYFDLRRELKAQPNGETASTPAINLIQALNASLEPIVQNIDAHGLESWWVEKKTMNDALLNAALALGCSSYAERVSPACVTLVPPSGVTGKDLVKALLARGARAQGGQDAIKDVICRISFMGHFDRYDALAFAGLLEDALLDCEARVVRGAGVAAAWKTLEALNPQKVA
jgi:aspartate aminotransferase-like enzyme